MPPPYSMVYRLSEGDRPVFEEELTGRVQLGRQDPAEGVDELYQTRRLDPNTVRLVIAREQVRSVSRKHVEVEHVNERQIRVTNLSKKVEVAIFLPEEIRLPKISDSNPRPTHDLFVPCRFHLGDPSSLTISIESNADLDDSELYSLAGSTRPVFSKMSSAEDLDVFRESGLEKAAKDSPDPERLVRWLQMSLQVLQESTTQRSFFESAARALVANVGLDAGWVMLLDDDGQWQVKARHAPRESSVSNERTPSLRFLNQVRQTRTTSWKIPGLNLSGTESLAGTMQAQQIRAAVASPIVNNKTNRVIGALYGDRLHHRQSAFNKLDALLVDLLAGIVGVGHTRLEDETQKEELQKHLVFVYGERLADHVQRDKSIVLPKEAEVTVLFADIRKFSTISRAIGPKTTFEWINDVMESLTKCVEDHNGLIVNYIGDEIMAMWGAPVDDSDQAMNAARAALQMHESIAELNKHWSSRLPEPIAVGIGVNTGLAEVGNTASQARFKYGPLGNTVNLASRLQGSTKYLKTSLIVSKSTHQRLDPSIESRRLCKIRVQGIKDPIDIFELTEQYSSAPKDPTDPDTAEWSKLAVNYEAALDAFEAKEFNQAARDLSTILADFPKDGPSLVLMKRAVNGLIEGPDKDHPVFELPGK